MTNHDPFDTVSSTDLENVQGGSKLTEAAKVGGKFLGRAVPIVNAGLSAYDGYTTYKEQRAKGKGVGESLGAAAKEWVKGATYYDLWKPTPAY